MGNVMKKYSAADAKAIIRSYGEKWIEFRDEGIHHSPDILAYDPGEELNWKYVLELDGDDVPNPLTAPCLPFPFTANELAAFMLDGIGAGVIAANYAGSWESGPDSGMLESFSRLGREAKRALCEAYAAVHAAEHAIGSSYPQELQKEVDRLGDECTQAPLDKGIREQHRIAEKRYREAFATWRKAMVNYLLRPAPETLSDSKPSWNLNKPRRFQGYGRPLYEVLKAAHRLGRPKPTAHDVMAEFERRKPSEIAKVIAGASFDYYTATGEETKTANIQALNEAIKRMTS